VTELHFSSHDDVDHQSLKNRVHDVHGSKTAGNVNDQIPHA
jgi:hypothetical protein